MTGTRGAEILILANSSRSFDCALAISGELYAPFLTGGGIVFSRSLGFGQFAGFGDFFRLAGNHGIWPGQSAFASDHARFRANLARGRFVQADDRGHAASGSRRKLSGYEFSALADHAQAVLKVIAPAAVSAVNSPSDNPAVASNVS